MMLALRNQLKSYHLSFLRGEGGAKHREQKRVVSELRVKTDSYTAPEGCGGADTPPLRSL